MDSVLNFRPAFIDAAYFAHCFTKYSNIGRESAHSFGFVTGPVMRSGCHCTDQIGRVSCCTASVKVCPLDSPHAMAWRPFAELVEGLVVVAVYFHGLAVKVS